MKTLMTMTAAAALIAGMSFASAQNAATPNNANPPGSSINAGAQTGTAGSKSGSESTAATTMKASTKNMHIVGKSKFCITQAEGSNGLNCKYASMQACNKEAKLKNTSCQPNPKMAGTGAKATTGMKAK